MVYAPTPIRRTASARVRLVAVRLTWLERTVLCAGIIDIVLQFDKYFGLREDDAMLGSLAGMNVSVTTVALFTLYGMWLVDVGLRRRRCMHRPQFGIPMLIYLAINVLSAAAALVSMLSLFDLVLLVQAYALFFFVANRLQSREDILFCVMAFAAALLTQGLVMLFAAAIHLDGETTWGPLLLRVDEGRHAGTMNSPNLAGSTLAVLWFPVAASLLCIRSRWAWRMACLCTATGLQAILMTQSRGAILTIGVGSLVIAVGLFSRGWLPKWTIAVAMLLAVISIWPLSEVYQNRIQHGDDDSASSRIHLSLIALDAIAERPLLGYGAGNCHVATLKFANQPPYRAEWFYTVHCKYLLVWVETGILGLLAFLLVLGNGFRHGLYGWRHGDPILSVLALSIVAALAGHMLHMSVDLFNSRSVIQALWCLLGLVAAIYQVSHQEAFQRSYRPRRIPAVRVLSATRGFLTSAHRRDVQGGTC